MSEHTFHLGDPVRIVGNYIPPGAPGFGVVVRLTPGETYDLWVRLGKKEYPFRSSELAPLATGGPIVHTAPVRRRPVRRDLITTLCIGLVLGTITGILVAPVRVVETRTTITHAVPEVCRAANAAGRIEMQFRKERDDAAGDAIAHGNLADAAANLGKVDERLRERDLANAAEIKRDEKEFARIGAEQSFLDHAAACDTWTAPARWTERVVSE